MKKINVYAAHELRMWIVTLAALGVSFGMIDLNPHVLTSPYSTIKRAVDKIKGKKTEKVVKVVIVDTDTNE